MRKQVRKMSLCTETLRNLDQINLRDVAGGSAAGTNCLACNTAGNCTATRLCSGCEPCD